MRVPCDLVSSPGTSRPPGGGSKWLGIDARESGAGAQPPARRPSASDGRPSRGRHRPWVAPGRQPSRDEPLEVGDLRGASQPHRDDRRTDDVRHTDRWPRPCTTPTRWRRSFGSAPDPQACPQRVARHLVDPRTRREDIGHRGRAGSAGRRRPLPADPRGSVAEQKRPRSTAVGEVQYATGSEGAGHGTGRVDPPQLQGRPNQPSQGSPGRAGMMASDHTHPQQRTELEDLPPVDDPAIRLRHSLRERLAARRARPDDPRPGETGPDGGVEGVIRMAVSAQDHVDPVPELRRAPREGVSAAVLS